MKNNYKFAQKRADDLFNRFNLDVESTISCKEFIKIYMQEIEEVELKRIKLASNLLKLKNRKRAGICYKVTRLFINNDLKNISE